MHILKNAFRKEGRKKERKEIISPSPNFSGPWVSPCRWAHAAWPLSPILWRTWCLPFVPLCVTFPELIRSCLHYSQLWTDERKKENVCFICMWTVRRFQAGRWAGSCGDSDPCCCLAGMSALLERRPAEEWGSVMAWQMHCCTWSSLLWGAVKLIVRFVVFVFSAANPGIQGTWGL